MSSLSATARLLLFCGVFSCALTVPPCTAQSVPSFWQRETLTGDWETLRTRLEERGVTLEGVYTGETFSNIGGIRQKTVYLDNVALTLTLDGKVLLGWPGMRLFVHGLGNQGGDPSRHIGDVQIVSNIETFDTWRLYEAWVEQQLFEEKLSLLAGLYDLNSEFDYIQTAQLFLNSSFGIGPEFSLSGENGPSVFPTTSLGFRVRVQPSPQIYVQTTILDGVPGDPHDPKRTQIILDDDDGILVATEMAYLVGVEDTSPFPYGKYAMGGWAYTADFDDAISTDRAGQPIRRGGTFGLYGFAEQTVLREQQDLSQGMALFVRLGIADPRVNRFGLYTGMGLVYTGLVPQRPDDQLGFGIAALHNSHRFRRARSIAGQPTANAEIECEVTYRAGILPWLTVQPSLQYVINPGTEKAIPDAFAIGLRFEIRL